MFGLDAKPTLMWKVVCRGKPHNTRKSVFCGLPFGKAAQVGKYALVTAEENGQHVSVDLEKSGKIGISVSTAKGSRIRKLAAALARTLT